MHWAIVGCSHGEMDTIYDTLSHYAIKFDLLICCGDFQAVRNMGDLQHMHVPPKYRELGTFYQYYSGQKVAPVLTLFVGGNHESSGYLSELPNGGWVAPNIYYMGYASVVQFGGMRIAGLSGIYKSHDYNRGHFERPPFNNNDPKITSAYHVRSLELFRLKQLRLRDDDLTSKGVNVVVTHDWPAGITDFGDCKTLLRIKPSFRPDIEQNNLGNPETMNLLYELKPNRWFSAHMHVRFPAEVEHKGTPTTTKFLALDKPLPRRSWCEVLEVPRLDSDKADDTSPRLELSYDPTWLAILKNTDFLTIVEDKRVYMPGPTNSKKRSDFRPTQQELDAISELFNNDFTIPCNFRPTAPPEPSNRNARVAQSLYYRNPQSTEFCEKLGINDFNYMLCQKNPQSLGVPYFCLQQKSAPAINQANSTQAKGNPDEINIGDVDNDDEFGGESFVIDATPAANLTESE
ncbi:calcineurin-like phosphoesterase domain-containing protein [Ditylenchus destructor]|nr:calcineurin-like phosphoesterase domain-containing protein [Ditylenchus destructor]